MSARFLLSLFSAFLSSAQFPATACPPRLCDARLIDFPTFLTLMADQRAVKMGEIVASRNGAMQRRSLGARIGSISYLTRRMCDFVCKILSAAPVSDNP